MKAFIIKQYGAPHESLSLVDLPLPTPKENEVTVRVHAVSLNALDWHLTRGDPYIVRFLTGFTRPKRDNWVAGSGFAGTVESIGASVTTFKVGDEVIADPGVDLGGLAEVAVVSHKDLCLKPANVSFAEAAAVGVSATTAFQALHDVAKVQAGQKVLVNGASGGVGTAAIQIAKAAGAQVTAVCSARNIDLVKSLGADYAIDYAQENFTQLGNVYDIIIDNVGTQSETDCCKVLSPEGVIVQVGSLSPKGTLTNGLLSGAVAGLFTQKQKGQRIEGIMAKAGGKCLEQIKPLLEQGALKPPIFKTFTFEQAPDALALQEEGHVAGKIVITVL
ncbi:alcohol dehydrogenase [Rhizoclosmatium globosum]|uniref:Alcohol dehydrogenase n=1 Tax=Rhizoclosmatium globosum TaxID=329046 RepID=A0A1Y2AV13_9FUNG|nr:alcohol dehydrogenase [Rhizoclosmatium globosum]|eukprot:ORY26433.1 alcohol dehydrogenase [Rhizoclosmatium globosum]